VNKVLSKFNYITSWLGRFSHFSSKAKILREVLWFGTPCYLRKFWKWVYICSWHTREAIFLVLSRAYLARLYVDIKWDILALQQNGINLRNCLRGKQILFVCCFERAVPSERARAYVRAYVHERCFERISCLYLHFILSFTRYFKNSLRGHICLVVQPMVAKYSRIS